MHDAPWVLGWIVPTMIFIYLNNLLVTSCNWISQFVPNKGKIKWGFDVAQSLALALQHPSVE